MVKDNQIVFPGGASYRLLILPSLETMTPALLEKIRSLVWDGAIVIGPPPLKSPGLSGFPECDKKVQSIAGILWGRFESPAAQTERIYGKGKIIWGGDFSTKKANELYPSYDLAAKLLDRMGVAEDFKSANPVRYTHRTTPDWDIYFVSNCTNEPIRGDCIFRTAKASPELWDPVTGKTRKLTQFSSRDGRTAVSLQFDAYQSFFIVFSKGTPGASTGRKNFPEKTEIASLNGPWDVSFDPKWGGSEKVRFDSLKDWTLRREEGIKYYSGIAVYRQSFDLPKAGAANKNGRLYLNLGKVKNLARVRLNGHDLGVVWTTPWRVDITEPLKKKDNTLEIEVANLWPNRLIGDEKLPDDGIKDGQWPDWLIKGKERTSGRYTFTTYQHYTKDSPLLESGLIGPVTIQRELF
ncbi:MAG: glycosylhydrolase-like jelly roll fold domain-containing protein [Segetibacter sp.]